MSITVPGFRAAATGPSLRSPAVLRTEVLAGLVVALALIPEAIAFSVIAGVDPRVGLFSTVTMAIAIAFTGGRPAMITAATAAVALVVAPVSREYGVGYLVATILLAGVIQLVLASLGVARLMRFIPRSVMVGFVNALAVLVFASQLPHLIGVPWLVYPLVAVGLLLMVALPKLTTAVPPPLLVVLVLTAAVVVFGWQVPDVGDQGALPDSLPIPGLPDVPLTLHTLQVIAPYALGAAAVGLLESLMTAKLVDEITDTPSNKTREAGGQGFANVVTALFGGMGGCAVVGQTMMNVKVAGARTRLSTLMSGVFVLILVVALGDLVGRIPMAALVAVMIVVSAATFDWHSVAPRTLKILPRSETLVMLVTVAGTVATGNLAVGVGLGVLAATLAFARRVAHFTSVQAMEGPDGTRTYQVRGDLFFVSSNDLVHQFDYGNDPDDVVVDLSGTSVWDASSVATLDAIRNKYASRGKSVRFTGVDAVSLDRLNRLSGRLGA
ncbi:SulP family inorganic anion transporter [Mycolicibacterium frederiksbergense]|uniref:SulP family inorganic anion transporter n=1 Tax=Mycolicibacterium frederiksbergense TaxID=117567 RepID=UPI00399981D0